MLRIYGGITTRLAVVLKQMGYVEDLYQAGEGAGNLGAAREHAIMAGLWQRYLPGLAVPGRFGSAQIQRLLLAVVDAQEPWNPNASNAFVLCRKGVQFVGQQPAFCMQLLTINNDQPRYEGPMLTFVFGDFALRQDPLDGLSKPVLVSPNPRGSLMSHRTATFTYYVSP